jgi:protein-tyrosine phosphatase
MAVVLFICTGNLCRSPSAEWFLAQRLSEVGPPGVRVESAGTMGTVSKVPPELQKEGIAYGLDLGSHVPRRVDADTVARADMVIGMERAHLREIVLADPPSFTRSFTLREIVRRGREHGQRRLHQPLADWLEQLGSGRRHVDLIGDSPSDDTPDPMGGSSQDFRTMLMELATLTKALHSLTWA